MAHQAHELTWGAFVIDSEAPQDTPWWTEALIDGATLGNPVPLVQVVQSMLTDGSLARTIGFDNREPKFKIRLNGPDGQSLAQGEAALMAELMAEQPAQLIWTPPAVGAWPVVLDVVTARLDKGYEGDWDLDEKLRSCRYYELTFNCLPWAHDLETTVLPALPVPEEPDEPALDEPIDACDSLTGWQISAPSVRWDSASMTLTGDGGIQGAGVAKASVSPAYMNLNRNGAVDMDVTPYLTIDVIQDQTLQPTTPPIAIATMTSGVGTGNLPILAMQPINIAGVGPAIRYIVEPPTLFDRLLVAAGWVARPGGATALDWQIYRVGRTDRIEVAQSNGFQLARIATVGGSAPTQAAITFDAGVDPLVGTTALIYTGESPAIPLRNVRHTSAGVTGDATMISGGRNDLSVPAVYLVPISRLAESTYSLLARMEFVGATTIGWTARIVDSEGGDIPGSEVVATGSVLAKNSSGAAWKIHVLGAIQLPVIAIEGGTTHAVELTISMPAGGAGVKIDEGWLLDTGNDRGAVTVIHEPSDDELVKIELRSPQLGSPRLKVIGTWDLHGAQDITARLVTALGNHVMKPGPVHIFTATDLAKYAQCWIEAYWCHHTHPGPPLPATSGAG